ncbi:hypothetical protein [Staphylococcus xylosus]|uniref:hypothetical protein n=1 Tax=Staphylococcus xylosus TaxID=1288 RepID=UPI001C3EA911|nr:hypothetical protein [Staphylococcus xylosus]
MNNYKFKPRKLNAGDFRTPITFFEYKRSGPYPDEEEKDNLYSCFAEMYSPSMKDREVLSSFNTSVGMTIVIRDPLQTYIPNNKHIVEINDYRLTEKRLNIIEVRFDTPEKGYITLVLGGIK